MPVDPSVRTRDGELLRTRQSGILLRPTSLPDADPAPTDNPGFATSLTPGRAGSGDFGPAAYRFVDWMAAAGQHLWQVLPLGPTGPGNSPYMSPSALALNPLLIDLTDLVGRGWLRGDTALPLRERGDDSRMAFGPVSRFRMQCLREAVRGFAAEPADGEAQTAFRAFCGGEVDWLDD